MTADPAFWNKLAEEYAAKPVDNPEAFNRKIAITLARMKPSDVVLDIGCGTGSLVLRLADSGTQLHGLDVSDEMVRIAREKAKAASVGNTTFHTGAWDETFTSLGTEALDGVCAYSLLHLVEDRDQALAQAFALLKPGGFFISSTVVLGDSWIPYAPLLAVMRWMGKAPMVKIISRATLKEDLIRAGFVDVHSPDVGAGNTVLFLVATKPEATVQA